MYLLQCIECNTLVFEFSLCSVCSVYCYSPSSSSPSSSPSYIVVYCERMCMRWPKNEQHWGCISNDKQQSRAFYFHFFACTTVYGSMDIASRLHITQKSRCFTYFRKKLYRWWCTPGNTTMYELANIIIRDFYVGICIELDFIMKMHRPYQTGLHFSINTEPIG